MADTMDMVSSAAGKRSGSIWKIVGRALLTVILIGVGLLVGTIVGLVIAMEAGWFILAC